jgi:predicted RNA binding protein YcfA (HicA-like mRNA interferase family)
MPEKLPVLKPREVVRALERAGFFVHHQTGSHARLFHTRRSELRVTVPIHSKDLPRTLLKRILKQADLDPEQFLEYL